MQSNKIKAWSVLADVMYPKIEIEYRIYDYFSKKFVNIWPMFSCGDFLGSIDFTDKSWTFSIKTTLVSAGRSYHPVYYE